VACREWERLAEAIIRRGAITDSAVLEKGLSFGLSSSGCKMLRDLGLFFFTSTGRCSEAPFAEDEEVVVDLLSLVCARGYSDCAVALINKMSDETLVALRAAGRLLVPLKVAMHTGDARVVRHLLLRLSPSLPLAQSQPRCLLDLAPSSSWMGGGIARLGNEGSFVLRALRAGRWEAVHEVLDYLVRLLSLSPSESLARQFAYRGSGEGGEGGEGDRSGASAAARENIFKCWVEEALLLGREVAADGVVGGRGGGGGVAEACSSIISLLDGQPGGKVREWPDVGKGRDARADEKGVDAHAVEAEYLGVMGRGQEQQLDANTWRIVVAMQHVVDSSDRGACPLYSALVECATCLSPAAALGLPARCLFVRLMILLWLPWLLEPRSRCSAQGQGQRRRRAT